MAASDLSSRDRARAWFGLALLWALPAAAQILQLDLAVDLSDTVDTVAFSTIYAF